MGQHRTTSLTLFIGCASAPGASRVTFGSDGLAYRRNGTIVDYDGDPMTWIVLTGDHVMNIADGDDGFRIQKGSASMGRILESKHRWKVTMTLSEFLEKDHPLTATAPTPAVITAAYAAHRATEA